MMNNNYLKNNPKQIRALIGSRPCFDRNTELARAVDVLMVRVKIIYILMVEVNKFIFFFASRYFLKEIENMFFVFLSGVIETLVKVWENSKKLWKHSPAAGVPTAFLVLPSFHSCFYNSTETRYMFSIS